MVPHKKYRDLRPISIKGMLKKRNILFKKYKTFHHEWQVFLKYRYYSNKTTKIYARLETINTALVANRIIIVRALKDKGHNKKQIDSVVKIDFARIDFALKIYSQNPKKYFKDQKKGLDMTVPKITWVKNKQGKTVPDVDLNK